MNNIKLKIVKLWEAGHSSNEIAIQLGITRGSVMGHIHRLREKGINLRSKVVLERNLQPTKEPDMPSREKTRKKPIPQNLGLLNLGLHQRPRFHSIIKTVHKIDLKIIL